MEAAIAASLRQHPCLTLPQKGCDILLLGQKDLCEPLAKALLEVQLDDGGDSNGSGDTGTGTKRKQATDRAIAALRYSPLVGLNLTEQRNVHMMETLNLPHLDVEDRKESTSCRPEVVRPSDIERQSPTTFHRMDQIVLVISPRAESNFNEYFVKEQLSRIHRDYYSIWRHQLCLVVAETGVAWSDHRTWLGKTGISERIVPVFCLQLYDPNSVLTLARILLQRASLASARPTRVSRLLF